MPIPVGPKAKIEAVAAENGLKVPGFQIVDEPHSHTAVQRGVALFLESRGEILMKGSLHTNELMHEVARSETELGIPLCT